MTTYIALLRAVNVGGKSVLMASLRDFAERVGFPGAQTLLQTGNLVFQSRTRSSAALEVTLETEAKRRIKLDTQFFVRTADDWDALVAANPFRAEAKEDPARLVLMLLKHAPSPEQVRALEAAIVGRERVRVVGTHAYFVYPDGMGKSKLTSALIARKLGTAGTARNWNTVEKIRALMTNLS